MLIQLLDKYFKLVANYVHASALKSNDVSIFI